MLSHLEYDLVQDCRPRADKTKTTFFLHSGVGLKCHLRDNPVRVIFWLSGHSWTAPVCCKPCITPVEKPRATVLDCVSLSLLFTFCWNWWVCCVPVQSVGGWMASLLWVVCQNEQTRSESFCIVPLLTPGLPNTLTHSFITSLTISVTHTRTHSNTHALPYSIKPSDLHSLAHILTHSLTHTQPCTNLPSIKNKLYYLVLERTSILFCSA